MQGCDLFVVRILAAQTDGAARRAGRSAGSCGAVPPQGGEGAVRAGSAHGPADARDVRFGNSRPCVRCVCALRECGVRRVFYTTGQSLPDSVRAEGAGHAPAGMRRACSSSSLSSAASSDDSLLAPAVCGLECLPCADDADTPSAAALRRAPSPQPPCAISARAHTNACARTPPCAKDGGEACGGYLPICFEVRSVRELYDEERALGSGHVSRGDRELERTLRASTGSERGEAEGAHAPCAQPSPSDAPQRALRAGAPPAAAAAPGPAAPRYVAKKWRSRSHAATPSHPAQRSSSGGLAA